MRSIMHNWLNYLILLYTYQHILIQRDLKAGIPVWESKLGAPKNFLVQYILSGIHSDK